MRYELYRLLGQVSLVSFSYGHSDLQQGLVIKNFDSGEFSSLLNDIVLACPLSVGSSLIMESSDVFPFIHSCC